jgi:hypothetical protein
VRCVGGLGASDLRVIRATRIRLEAAFEDLALALAAEEQLSGGLVIIPRGCTGVKDYGFPGFDGSTTPTTMSP